MSYLLTTYHWPLLSCPQVAGFRCPVTERHSKFSMVSHSYTNSFHDSGYSLRCDWYYISLAVHKFKKEIQ